MKLTVTAIFLADFFLGCFVSEKEAQRWVEAQGRFITSDDPTKGLRLVPMDCEVNLKENA